MIDGRGVGYGDEPSNASINTGITIDDISIGERVYMVVRCCSVTLI
jgi:hypothetical protein